MDVGKSALHEVYVRYVHMYVHIQVFRKFLAISRIANFIQILNEQRLKLFKHPVDNLQNFITTEMMLNFEIELCGVSAWQSKQRIKIGNQTNHPNNELFLLSV